MSQVANAYTVVFPREAFYGVWTRRFFGWMLDLFIVVVLTGLIGLLFAVLTLGLSLFLLPPIFPVIAVLYYATTVSGSGRATFGMRAFGLEVVRHDNGGRPPFLNAAAQSLLFYLSWAFPLLFFVTLIDGEKRFLHDILSGLVVVRRPN